jgi:homoserine acetyltransferase
MERPIDYQFFQLGDFTLQGGATLRGARIAYKTYGTLDADRSNAVVYPTWYSGRHWDNEWLIGPGKSLDPDRYFVIVPNMLGNGLSTSPSNITNAYRKARFPDVTVYDNIEAQYRLVTEQFGIEQLALVTGLNGLDQAGRTGPRPSERGGPTPTGPPDHEHARRTRRKPWIDLESAGPNRYSR